MAVTRLGPSGLPAILYGSFAGKTAEDIVPVPTMIIMSDLAASTPTLANAAASTPTLANPDVKT